MPLLREAVDRKQENMRRRRRRDALRLHLNKMLLLIAQKKTFANRYILNKSNYRVLYATLTPSTQVMDYFERICQITTNFGF